MHRLFYESLATFGVLALGQKETIRFISARAAATRSSTPQSGSTGRSADVRGDRDRRLVGRSGGDGHACSRACPDDVDQADRRRPAPLARGEPWRASSRCSAARRAAGDRAERQGRARARPRCTSRRRTTTCSSRAGASRSRSRRASSTPAVHRRPVRVGRRRVPRAKSIGIVLTGANEDGAAGLAAIKRNWRRLDRPGSRARRAAGRCPTRRSKRRRSTPCCRSRRSAAFLHGLCCPCEHRRPSILLVDDRPENLLALEAILEPARPGARPRPVGRGGAASPAPRRVRRDPARRADARAWTASRPPS